MDVNGMIVVYGEFFVLPNTEEGRRRADVLTQGWASAGHKVRRTDNANDIELFYSETSVIPEG